MTLDRRGVTMESTHPSFPSSTVATAYACTGETIEPYSTVREFCVLCTYVWLQYRLF